MPLLPLFAASGSLYSWGEGKFGRLGHGNESNVLIPHLIESLRGVVITGVSCGGFHTAAVSGACLCLAYPIFRARQYFTLIIHLSLLMVLRAHRCGRYV